MRISVDHDLQVMIDRGVWGWNRDAAHKQTRICTGIPGIRFGLLRSKRVTYDVVRNRYFDLLRAIAIVRVVVYHATEWAFLTIAFPAMGTMFALAGSLMASSLDRHGLRAVALRARRLLPPLWTIAVVAVPAMLATGMAADWRLVFWVLPLYDPPSNWWGSGILHIVWYLREFAWFVLLSPLVLPVFRRWPVPTLVVPFALLGSIEAGLPAIPAVRDFGLYFGCWLLGFAHHDGMLHRMRRAVLLAIAAVTASAGAAWFLTHPSPRGYHLSDIPLGDALWSVGFVLLLLGLAPERLDWLDRWRPVSWLVTTLNSRAVTVYLWHKAVIIAAGAIGLGIAARPTWWHDATPIGLVAWLVTICVGIFGCIVAFGWVEDLAARRRPVLLPRVEEWAGARTPAALSRRRVGPARAEAG